MLRPAVNQIISKNESPYSLVIAVAKRAREISDELYENNMTLEEFDGVLRHDRRTRSEWT